MLIQPFFDARGGSWSLVITQNSNANQPTISFYGFLALRFRRRIVLGFFFWKLRLLNTLQTVQDSTNLEINRPKLCFLFHKLIEILQANFGPYCFHIPQTLLWAICKTWRHRPDIGWVIVPWFGVHWGKQEEVRIPFFLIVLAIHHWNHLLSRAHALGFLPVEHHHEMIATHWSVLMFLSRASHLIWLLSVPYTTIFRTGGEAGRGQERGGHASAEAAVEAAGGRGGWCFW